MSARSPALLPDDRQLGELDAGVRRVVAAVWRARATHELSTSTVFASLARSLVGLRAPLGIVLDAAQAVGDEVRHAQICAEVARAYWPGSTPPEPSPVIDEPARGGDAELGAVLFAVMQSCINEGVASVYLQRCLLESRFVLVRAALRRILEDEIRHARFGWTLLASEVMSDALRRDVAEALPVLLARVRDTWTAEDGVTPADGPPGHGFLSTAAIADVVREAYEDLVLPGFERTAIDTGPARALVSAAGTGHSTDP